MKSWDLWSSIEEDIDIGNGYFMNDYVMEKKFDAFEVWDLEFGRPLLLSYHSHICFFWIKGSFKIVQ